MSLDLTVRPATGPTADGAAATAPRRLGGADSIPAPTAAVRAATDRDLGRLVRVLAEPITPVRRAALVAHICFLVDQMRSAEDELRGRPAAALSRLRHEARGWARDPGRRPQLRAAATRAADALRPLPDQPAPAEQRAADSGVRLIRLAWARPTLLAYRYFWLLDDAPAHRALPVIRGYSRPARWVLRNVLSGGYNRRAHLMWVGGGSGSAA